MSIIPKIQLMKWFVQSQMMLSIGLDPVKFHPITYMNLRIVCSQDFWSHPPGGPGTRHVRLKVDQVQISHAYFLSFGGAKPIMNVQQIHYGVRIYNLQKMDQNICFFTKLCLNMQFLSRRFRIYDKMCQDMQFKIKHGFRYIVICKMCLNIQSNSVKLVQNIQLEN